MFEPGSFKWVYSGYLPHKSWLWQEITWKHCRALFASIGAALKGVGRAAIQPLALLLVANGVVLLVTFVSALSHNIEWRALQNARQEFEQKKTATPESATAEVMAQSEELKNRFASIESRPREIMGENFIGISEVAKHLKVKFSEAELQALSKIPYSEELLQELKSSHLLVPMVPLSIVEICERAPEVFNDQKWYIDQKFARDERCRLGWLLMRIDAVPDSTGKNYNDQLTLLSADEEVSNACEAIYGMTLRRLVRGDCLFGKVLVRTSTKYSGHVNVDFLDGRLYISYWHDGPSDDVGLASSRKFQIK